MAPSVPPPTLKLMIPGPIDIWDETLQSMSQQVYPYYGPEFPGIYWETIDLVKRVFQTQNDIVLMTAPGSAALEAGLCSLFTQGEKVAVVNNGQWGSRIKAILDAYNVQAIMVDSVWGQAADLDAMRQTLHQHPDLAGIAVVANETSTGVVNPVQALAQLAQERQIPIFVDAVSAMGGYHLPVDAWGLDIVCCSSNKALELPPGLGLISVSERAWQLIEAKKGNSQRGWYLNLSTWQPTFGSSQRAASPNTVSTSLVVALHTSLTRILEQETLLGHWARYVWARDVARAGLRATGFSLLANDTIASPTVTAFAKRDDMEDSDVLRTYLIEKHRVMLGAVGGPLAGQVLRIGHMGKAGSQEYLSACLLGIEDFVRRELGVDLAPGTSLIGLTTQETWY